MNKEFTRSRKDRVFSGVCGGLARLLGVQSWIIRLALVLLALFGDLMAPLVILYIVLACILKEDEGDTVTYTVDGQPGQGMAEPSGGANGDRGNLWALGGVALVAVGGMILLREFYGISLSRYGLPVILIVVGVGAILWALRRPDRR